MKDPNFIAQEAGLNFNSVVEAIIKHSCIIDYGIIQNIVADGVVDVSVAVSRTEQDMVCMTCVLANIASGAFTLNVKPSVGDRVLVVYPRIYDDKMFTVPDSDTDKKKLTVNYEANGYNLMSGIAILINQYKEASHKNVITVDKDSIEAEVIEGKTKMQIDSNGNITVDTNGKYTIKNSLTDLLTVISKLVDEIESLVIVCPNGAGSINPTSVAKLETWKQQLQTLLASPPVTP